MTGFGDESLGHCSSHVAPFSQVNEHEPVQVMWHVEPPLQSILPLGPSVIEHVDVPAHLRLHEEPHAPVQSVLFSQSRVQLLGPQLLLVMSHVLADGHVHVEPVQLGATPLLPQPTDTTTSSADTQTRMYFIRRSYSHGRAGYVGNDHEPLCKKGTLTYAAVVGATFGTRISRCGYILDKIIRPIVLLVAVLSSALLASFGV